jgi:hypothetical protein
MCRRVLILLIVLSTLGLLAPLAPVRAQYSIDYVITPYQPDILDSWFFGINDRGETTDTSGSEMPRAGSSIAR